MGNIPIGVTVREDNSRISRPATGAATSVAGWLNVVLLWLGLRRSGFMKLSSGFTGRVVRLLLAAAAMGVWCQRERCG